MLGTYTENSKLLFQDEINTIDWREKYMELEQEHIMLRHDLQVKNDLIKKSLQARVSKPDKGSWMNLTFGVNIPSFAKKVFRSVI
jgi:hypothetical protein